MLPVQFLRRGTDISSRDHDRLKNECILCDFQQRCAEKSIYLYAATPILRQIVESALQDLGAEFQLKNELFVIGGDFMRAIQGLRARLSDAERADIRVSGQQGAAILAAATLDNYGFHIDTNWFDNALVNDQFSTFFQPIVDTRTSAVFAHECLIRLASDRIYNGGEIIEAAASRGAIHLFDSYARRLSIRSAGAQWTPGSKVFVNFMPSSIYDPVFCMASTLDEMSRTILKPSDIVFEVVESDKIADVKHLTKICDYYRKGGFGFALDDVGTGSNSLQMVCDLKPDFIKIDKSLISNISQTMYRTAVQKLAEFAHQFQVQVIAEGIEDPETASNLQQLNIHLMQGYYFARPSPRMTASGMAANLIRIGQQLGESVDPQLIGQQIADAHGRAKDY
jgi:EAL domain-containing protein (putative c-di-GMP-specific phosphodiesterase class I)